MSSETKEAVEEFMIHEAEILDDGKLREWLDLVSEDITYQVPIRTARENESPQSQFSDESYHFNENRASLEARIDRFSTDYAWVENPRSRTRRFVSNVRITEDEGDTVSAKSNLLLFRNRENKAEPELISGERRDTLSRNGDSLEIEERTVLLDHTLLETRDLAIFL